MIIAKEVGRTVRLAMESWGQTARLVSLAWGGALAVSLFVAVQRLPIVMW